MAAEVDALPGPAARVKPTAFDRLLWPIHWLVWQSPERRAKKLLRFAETESEGGRDLARAAELTQDGLLRRLYLRHAMDEQRHADLFRRRGRALLLARPKEGAVSTLEMNWLAPGERGLDDLRVERETDDSLLAFLHLSERAAARRFALYERVLTKDPETRQVFADILRDEAFHMNYTHAQLRRIEPRRHGIRLYWARAGRLWNAYLRVATALAGFLGAVVLTLQYFLLLPVFAWFAKRAARRENEGFVDVASKDRAGRSLESQY